MRRMGLAGRPVNGGSGSACARRGDRSMSVWRCQGGEGTSLMPRYVLMSCTLSFNNGRMATAGRLSWFKSPSPAPAGDPADPGDAGIATDTDDDDLAACTHTQTH